MFLSEYWKPLGSGTDFRTVYSNFRFKDSIPVSIHVFFKTFKSFALCWSGQKEDICPSINKSMNKLTAGSLTLMTVPSSLLVANNMVPSKRYSPFNSFSPSFTRVFLILVTSSSGLKSTLCWTKFQLGLFWIWKQYYM